MFSWAWSGSTRWVDLVRVLAGSEEGEVYTSESLGDLRYSVNGE